MKGYKERLINNKKQFPSYLWELYLISFLVKKGVTLYHSSKNTGPDIKTIIKDKTVWIECISPECGENDYKVPPMDFNGVFELPLEEIKQRLKKALLDKVNRYKDYIKDKKIVNQNDVKYIAINTSNISQYRSLMDVSEPLLLTVCREINFFESNKEIDGLIYSHKSIFEYSNNIEITIINKDYSLNKADCKLV